MESDISQKIKDFYKKNKSIYGKKNHNYCYGEKGEENGEK